MPDNLIATLTEDELADVMEYLSTLKTASLTPDSSHIAGPIAADGDAAIDNDFGPRKRGGPDGQVRRGGVEDGAGSSTGYFDLAAFHGKAAVNSVSYLHRVIESPVDQEATVLFGVDDGCRLFANGEKVSGH